jgi:hypothetical protein
VKIMLFYDFGTLITRMGWRTLAFSKDLLLCDRSTIHCKRLSGEGS